MTYPCGRLEISESSTGTFDFEPISVTHQARHLRFAVAVLVAIALLGPPAHAAPQSAAALRAEYKELSTNFAASAPDWRPKAPATGSLLFVAPDEYTPASNVGDQYREPRNKYADSLFALAMRAAAAGQLSLAFQWATETVRENPDHAEARRVLGYEPRDGQWLTAYGAKMFDSGKKWNPKSGWVSTDDPKPSPGKRNNWFLRTDHFLVSTNYSGEAAAELAARLELLHQIWRQLFAGFYLPEREVRQLFDGDRVARGQPKPFRVFYYRNRSEYADALRRRQPRIDETLGIYFDTFREAHFFAGGDQDAGTLYHEAVHQLFQESRPATKMVGSSANFWIIEGVATYFETLTEHVDPRIGRYYTIGELTKGRLPSARRQLKENSSVPLAELTRLGKEELQQPANIARRYSQSCGLAAFLIDGEQGRYREPLVRYLQAIYTGHDSVQTLVETTGASYSELDAAYRRYLESLP